MLSRRKGSVMTRSQLHLVTSQSTESLFVHRLTEVRDAWATVAMVPFLPQGWFALYAALDRLEAERLRFLKTGR